jgi:hypothetical protein
MDHLRLNKMVILFRCKSLIFTSSLFQIIFLDRSGRSNYLCGPLMGLKCTILQSSIYKTGMSFYSGTLLVYEYTQGLVRILCTRQHQTTESSWRLPGVQGSVYVRKAQPGF